MILDFINWNANPAAFTIANHEFRWYGLLLATGFYIGYFLLRKILRREKFNDDNINILAIYIFAGTIIGLRLGHCLFYEPGYYLSHPLDILKVWEGGLASHGAAVGVLLAVFIYSRRKKMTYIGLLDKVVIIIPLVGAIVRIGNLMNSEIFGMPTTMPWGFLFVHAGKMEPRHPTQIYEAVFCLLIFAVLMYMFFKKNAAAKTGLLFGTFLVMLFVFRFFVEFLKDVQVDFEKTMPVNMGQILSIPFIIAGSILLYRAIKNNNGVKVPDQNP